MFCRWPSKLGAMHTPLSTLKRSRNGASGLISEVASVLHAVLADPGIGLLAEVVLDLAGLGHRQRARIEHVGGIGAAVQHDQQEEVRVGVGSAGREEAGAGQQQRAGAERAEAQDVAS